MDSFSNPSTGSSQQLSAQDIRKQLKNQLALEYAQQFLERKALSDRTRKNLTHKLIVRFVFNESSSSVRRVGRTLRERRKKISARKE
ncbi:hypothetical protein DEO72_LG1g2369 [Vigna unguiculata]|uniref:Uncharacterized protein n=1 Tax=Vigna unguiculata TaxID=3917 RepID=A0A4D6KQE6_VIGUN|nr:hypothetical protein DEO72_LG1g2369 [Vigna unguiculata]